ncbi:MAG: iron-containing alcohol dehydrogenase [Nitrospirae bacterium]|nr:iron-containing alcohol dehydrogenase [Nitrospirota bacterium]
MLSGVYRNPTTIFFGRGVELTVGEEVKKYSKKILLHYGGESFKKYGLYEKVANSLKSSGIEFIELGGVKSNPEAGLIYEGINICRKEKIDFILAVGGGSVIDSAKTVGIGVPYEGDFIDFFNKKQIPQKSLKIGTILTVPGSGSESSDGAVITNERVKVKYDCGSPVMYPVFSMLNPEITFTVPRQHTFCGIVDAITHVLERYFSNTAYVDCSDRICEGLVKTLMKYALLVDKEPDNYEVRAEIMWGCKLAHDNTAGFGRKQDWASHKISHEIGSRYAVAHGAILAVIFPAWMKYVYKTNEQIFLQFANRVFDIEKGALENSQAILVAIDKFQLFLKAIGMPSTLQEIGLINKTEFADIANNCVSVMPSGTIGNFVRLSTQDIELILNSCF